MGCASSNTDTLEHHINGISYILIHYNEPKSTLSIVAKGMCIDANQVPNFVVKAIEIANEYMYKSVIYSYKKDIFFYEKNVYTIQYAESFTYKNIKKIMSRTVSLRNVLTPDEAFYLTSCSLLFLKMEACDFDLWNYVTSGNKLNIKKTFLELAQTLKKLHEDNIYLLDLKLENIFGTYEDNDIHLVFADLEYVFIDPPFLTRQNELIQKFECDIFKQSISGKFKWVKTYEYTPDSIYPYTREIAIRNDVFAFARCLGSSLMLQNTGSTNLMYFGNRKMEIYDLRNHVQAQFPDNVILQLCGNIIVEYNKFANNNTLNQLINELKK